MSKISAFDSYDYNDEDIAIEHRSHDLYESASVS